MVTDETEQTTAAGEITFVSTESGRQFTAADLSLAEEVGLRAGIAIEHTRLYQGVRQASDQQGEGSIFRVTLPLIPANARLVD